MISGKTAGLTALFVVSTSVAFAETGTVKADRVNVRGVAGLVGEVITQLSKGESVTVLEPVVVKASKGDPTNWFKIALPANTPLWVNAAFVATNNTVSAKKLNVRGGPGENFSVVARLEKGAELKVLRHEGDWLEVQAPTGAVAYVVASFIELSPKPTVSETPAKAVPVVVSEAKATPVAEIKPEPAVVVAQDRKPETEASKPPVAPAIPPATPVLAPAVPNPPAVPATAVAVSSAPVASDGVPAVARKVFREGIVRRDLHVNTPSYFNLEDRYSGEKIAFLIANEEKFELWRYIGSRVILGGEEFLDDRWKRTPIIKIETLDLP